MQAEAVVNFKQVLFPFRSKEPNAAPQSGALPKIISNVKSEGCAPSFFVKPRRLLVLGSDRFTREILQA